MDREYFTALCLLNRHNTEKKFGERNFVQLAELAVGQFRPCLTQMEEISHRLYIYNSSLQPFFYCLSLVQFYSLTICIFNFVFYTYTTISS